MNSGAEKLRFGKRRPNRSPFFILIIVLLLAIIGFLSWPLIKNRFNLTSGQPEKTGLAQTEALKSQAAEPKAAEKPTEVAGQADQASPLAEKAPQEESEPIAEVSPEASQLSYQSPELVVGESSVRQILDNVMAAWVSALDKGDFSQFHQMISASWQQKDSPAQLKATFVVLSPYLENLRLFPSRGKLVLLESRPFAMEGLDGADGMPWLRDNLGPESPWLVKGEWRVNKTALGFTLVLSLENGQWKPTGLMVKMFK
ncbi:MAG: hypothetical protein LBE80_08205 [Deltaproteobacteria bacterium]|jgi:hypothetical protein|nr:hypothetical protein [Deltaproteobacteria bacterium]